MLPMMGERMSSQTFMLRGMVLRGEARHGLARLGEAWHGMARHGKVLVKFERCRIWKRK